MMLGEERRGFCGDHGGIGGGGMRHCLEHNLQMIGELHGRRSFGNGGQIKLDRREKEGEGERS